MRLNPNLSQLNHFNDDPNHPDFGKIAYPMISRHRFSLKEMNLVASIKAQLEKAIKPYQPAYLKAPSRSPERAKLMDAICHDVKQQFVLVKWVPNQWRPVPPQDVRKHLLRLLDDCNKKLMKKKKAVGSPGVRPSHDAPTLEPDMSQLESYFADFSHPDCGKIPYPLFSGSRSIGENVVQRTPHDCASEI